MTQEETLEEKIERVELIVENTELKDEIKNLRGRTGELVDQLDQQVNKPYANEEWDSRRILDEVYKFSELPSNNHERVDMILDEFKFRYYRNQHRKLSDDECSVLSEYLCFIRDAKGWYLPGGTVFLRTCSTLLFAGIGATVGSMVGTLDSSGDILNYLSVSAVGSGVLGFFAIDIMRSITSYKINKKYSNKLDLVNELDNK